VLVLPPPMATVTVIQVAGMRSMVHCFKADLRWWNDLTSGNLRSAFLLSHLISNSGGVIEPIVDSAPTPAPDAADAEEAVTPRTPATPSG
jgi:hypothetical protein